MTANERAAAARELRKLARWAAEERRACMRTLERRPEAETALVARAAGAGSVEAEAQRRARKLEREGKEKR